jgi:F-type H+-transporting ATPase subunit a
MKYSPDQYILWERSFVQINLTLVFTWVVMAIIILLALITRFKLTNKKKFSGFQNFFEIIIDFIEEQILKIGGNDISNTVPFITTLFIFILFSNILSLIPKFISPTGSLSTVTALSISVIIMDIFYRTKRAGVAGYFKKYLKPSPVAFLTLGFPVFVQLITLVTSVVQAYIFSVLAMIYIS